MKVRHNLQKVTDIRWRKYYDLITAFQSNTESVGAQVRARAVTNNTM